MNYIKVSEAAEKWGISARRARILCAEGKVEGVIRKGKLYMVPENALKPLDGRRSKNNVIMEVDYKKEKLAAMRPLTDEKKNKLYEEGISLELAQLRKQEIKELKYGLSFSIPKQKQEAVEGEARISFLLQRPQEIILDFRENADKIKGVSVNGQPSEQSALI